MAINNGSDSLTQKLDQAEARAKEAEQNLADLIAKLKAQGLDLPE
jgi:hypothetical protein